MTRSDTDVVNDDLQTLLPGGVVFPKIHVHPEPQSVTFLGNKVFKDGTRPVTGRSL